MALLSLLLRTKVLLLVVGLILQHADITMGKTDIVPMAQNIQDLESRLEAMYNSNNMEDRLQVAEAERRLAILYNLEGLPDSERLLPLLAILGKVIISAAAPSLIEKGGQLIQGAIGAVSKALNPAAKKGATRSQQVAAMRKATQALKKGVQKAKAREL
jgi:hypothetical protein